MAMTKNNILAYLKQVLTPQYLNKILNPIGAGVIQAGQNIRTGNTAPATDIPSTIGGAISGTAQGAGNIAQNVAQGAGNIAQQAYQGAGNLAQQAYQGAGNLYQGAKESLSGTPGQQLTFDRFDPDQSAALYQLLQSGLQGLDFGALEGQARKGFYENTVPTLAERFTSLGQGSQQSSGFRQSLGREGVNLESQLAALKSQRGLQMLGLGLTPKVDSIYSQRQPGFAEQLLLGLSGGAGMNLASRFM